MVSLLPSLATLGEVILINVVLSGDNAIVVGLAAAGLPAEQRQRAILFGIGAAAILRILFALVASQLLAIHGILLLGGLLLLWISWRLWREIRSRDEAAPADGASGEATFDAGVVVGGHRKALRHAFAQIVLADISMSLDNVLAVSGAARGHSVILVVGLALSVVLVGAAATLIVRLLKAWPSLAYVGLAVIVFVAAKMLWDGGVDLLDLLRGTVEPGAAIAA